MLNRDIVTLCLTIEKKKNVELVRSNNIASARLLWLVHALEYFQCAIAYQLLRSKTLVSAR